MSAAIVAHPRAARRTQAGCSASPSRALRNRLARVAGLTALTAGMSVIIGCAAQQPHDYSAYRAHMPRSILVLPPRNESVDVNAPYSYLSTITRPLAEAGYYVFPVAVIDQFLKDNGLPTPDEMHTASLAKIRQIIGADAVLYVTIEEWGQKYQVLQSTTVVKARATLVDTASGTTLWDGKAVMSEGSGGGGDPIVMIVAAVVDQVLDTSTDRCHDIAQHANVVMIYDPQHGLLPGPRSPSYATDNRGR